MCERVQKYRAKKRKLTELKLLNSAIKISKNKVKNNCQRLEMMSEQETHTNERYVSI